MDLLASDAARDHVDGLVHYDTQATSHGLDLTAGAIHRLTGPGHLDFGGSEFAPAEHAAIEPERAHPDDDYGWWSLMGGTYRVVYNETLALPDGYVAHLTSHERLLDAGAQHPATTLTGAQDPLTTLLTVSDAGCRIKENSRISRLSVYAG
jgi:deoxycytidine triphosphate deaminase